MNNRYVNNKISVEFLKLLLRTVIAATSLAYNDRSETLQFSRTLQTLIYCIQLYTCFSNEIRVPIIGGFHSNILNDIRSKSVRIYFVHNDGKTPHACYKLIFMARDCAVIIK